MNSLLIKNASAVITCDSKDTVMEHANLLINNGVISYIGPEAQTADETLDASGYLVYPGLINTHHHLYQTFSRNLPQVQNMELFDWLTTLYEIWKNLDQDVIYHSSITGMGELLKTGCTTCFDHHYVFPDGNSDALLDAQFSAARPWDSYVRFTGQYGSKQKGWRTSPRQRRTECGGNSEKMTSGMLMEFIFRMRNYVFWQKPAPV